MAPSGTRIGSALRQFRIDRSCTECESADRLSYQVLLDLHLKLKMAADSLEMCLPFGDAGIYNSYF